MATLTSVGATAVDECTARSDNNVGKGDETRPAPNCSNPSTEENGGPTLVAGVDAESLSEGVEIIPVDLDTKTRLEEVIELSSDSEGESRERVKDNAKNDEDDLEIVQEMPYSYKNRSRGPPTTFLKALLQDTNREIQLGRKISENSYQHVEGGLGNILSRGQSVTSVRTNFEEVILSSDEDEDDKSFTAKGDSKVSASEALTDSHDNHDESNPKNLNIRSRKRLSDALSDEENEHEHNLSNSPNLHVVKKRSKTTDEGSRPSLNASEHASSSSASLRNTAEVRKLEKILRAKAEERRALGEEVMSLDDLEDEDSAFIRQERLNSACNQAFKTLCELTSCSTKIGRPIERKIKLTNGSGYPRIDQEVENFINSKEIDCPPDYIEISDLVRKTAPECPDLSGSRIPDLSEALFKDVLKLFRQRRVLDSFNNGYCKDMSGEFLKVSTDPAASSPELAAKLDENKRLRKSIAEVEDAFHRKQMELESTNPKSKLLEPVVSDDDEAQSAEEVQEDGSDAATAN